MPRNLPVRRQSEPFEAERKHHASSSIDGSISHSPLIEQVESNASKNLEYESLDARCAAPDS